MIKSALKQSCWYIALFSLSSGVLADALNGTNISSSSLDSDLGNIVRYNNNEYGIWYKKTPATDLAFFQAWYQICANDTTMRSSSTCAIERRDAGGGVAYKAVAFKALNRINVQNKTACSNIASDFYDKQNNKIGSVWYQAYSSNDINIANTKLNRNCIPTRIVANSVENEQLNFILLNRTFRTIGQVS